MNKAESGHGIEGPQGQKRLQSTVGLVHTGFVNLYPTWVLLEIGEENHLVQSERTPG